MPSPSSTFSFKRDNPLAGLLLFVLTVIVIEIGLSFLPRNALLSILDQFHTPEKSPDWQIMGDSVAAGGIRHQKLAAMLSPQTTVVNAALSASGPEFPYFILQRELAAGVAPRAILYAPSPHTFGTKRVALLVGGFATWPEIGEVAASGIEPLEVLYGIACKLSYTLRQRGEIADFLKGHRPTAPAESSAEADAAPAKEDKERTLTRESVDSIPRTGFTTTAFNLHFLHQFLHEAAVHKIPVYWVSMPTLTIVNEVRAPFHFEDDYQRFLTANQEHYGATLLLPHSTALPPKNFKDNLHLTPATSERFTETLGQMIQQIRPADRR